MLNLQEPPQAGTGPHIVLVPSAGMGHLVPFSRLAASFSNLCQVSLVSILPTISSAESRQLSDLFSSYPQIRPLNFELPPFDFSAYPNADPFFLRFERINRSISDLMTYLISHTPQPISGFVIDITLSSSFLPLAKSLGIPCYILFTSSASMLSFCAYFPTFYDSNSLCMSDVEIPGLGTIPVGSIPKALHNPKHLFTSSFVKNGRDLIKTDGLLVNTFESFENETLTTLRCGRVQPVFPPVISIGPLVPIKSSVLRLTSLFSWLDNQPDKSVVYVSFGSRTTMSKEQIQELARGLEASKCRFLWIVKTTVVDNEEEMKIEDLLGEGFLKRVKNRGLAIKGWVEQEEILEHKAIGGFISHCGWNSVIEAAMNDVRVLAWPRSGDQRINAGVVPSSGLGIWAEDWSWEGDKELVIATNIAQSVKQLMTNEGLMDARQRIREEARKAAEPGGGLAEGFQEIVRKLV